jgi:hypothetical protein
MKEHGLLFSAPMIRALLGGYKTRTRRMDRRWMKVKKGDRLWVREAAKLQSVCAGSWVSILYKADNAMIDYQRSDHGPFGLLRWTPSIHMPRWASRILLVAMADAYLERLQNMSEAEAKAEGGLYHDGQGIGHSGWRHDPQHGFVYATARESFQVLWNSLNGKHEYGWDANPEVVILSFTVLEVKTDSAVSA